MKEGNFFFSFLSSPPLLALLLVPFFARSLTLAPRSLCLNRTETLATQAKGSTDSRIHYFLSQCIAFNQTALRHISPE